jgi:hypothetical protein
MNDIYLVIKTNGSNTIYSGYYNFKEMCDIEGLDRTKLDKNKLPVQIGANIRIIKIKIK